MAALFIAVSPSSPTPATITTLMTLISSIGPIRGVTSVSVVRPRNAGHPEKRGARRSRQSPARRPCPPPARQPRALGTKLGSSDNSLGVASAFSHLLIGAAVGLIARPRLSAVLHDSDPQPSTTSTPQAPTKAARLHAALPWLCAVVAVVPDADVLAHAFVDYAHAFGHRGVFHSLLFY